MTRIAVMQPYLFPYIGYFQLINAVDIFVVYDDVDFIKNGWINRNKILISKEPKYFTVPCTGASSNKKIKDVEHRLDEKLRDKLFKKIRFTYGNAPFFKEVYPLLKEVVNHKSKFIADLAIKSIEVTSSYLELDTIFKRSSCSYRNTELGRAKRLIDICKQEGIKNYVNLAGGKELYDKSDFKAEGINLTFLEPQKVEYTQFGDPFIPWLSIVDVLMFNSAGDTREMLTKYRLT